MDNREKKLCFRTLAKSKDTYERTSYMNASLQRLNHEKNRKEESKQKKERNMENFKTINLEISHMLE